MQCPFRWKSKWRFSLGVASSFVDYVDEDDEREEAAYNEKYPTCWKRFLHWFGWN